MQLLKFNFNIIFVLFLCVSPFVKGQQDTLQIKTDTVQVHKHSPAKAAFLSAAFPGLGQIYNGKGIAYRLPILYVGMAAEAVTIIILNRNYNQYHNTYVSFNNYLHSIKSTPDFKKLTTIISNSGISQYNGVTIDGGNYERINANLKDNNDVNRHYRDLNIIVMAGIYFLNIVDATVQAYFFEYDISDNLSLKVQPTIMNNLTNKNVVGLKMTFNLH